MYSEATYDNTVNNPENPNSPPADVDVGENTTDEMMLFYFSYLPYKAGDENIVVDTFRHKPHHNNCVSVFTSVDEHLTNELKLYPNPAHSVLYIETGNSADFQYIMYNQLGQVILSGENASQIDMSGLLNGVYYVVVSQGGVKLGKLIVKE